MTIMCDCDGVLNDLVEKVLCLYNLRSGNDIRLEDITEYDFYKCMRKDDAKSIISLFKEKELWDSLSPTPGSQDVLKRLSDDGHKIYIATATDAVNFEWKTEWIKRHYSFIPQDNIIRIVNKGLLRTDVMIEDHIDNLTSNNCDRICIDYPYNRDNIKDWTYDIYRVMSWYEIEDVINKIERKRYL